MGRHSDTESEDASPSERMEHTAAQYCELISVLHKMTNPTVRADFLTNRVLRCKDIEPDIMLAMLDSLHQIFLPNFVADSALRMEHAELAGMHFRKLIDRVRENFVVPSDIECPIIYTYETWSDAILRLIKCPHWSQQEAQSSRETEAYAHQEAKASGQPSSIWEEDDPPYSEPYGVDSRSRTRSHSKVSFTAEPDLKRDHRPTSRLRRRGGDAGLVNPYSRRGAKTITKYDHPDTSDQSSDENETTDSEGYQEYRSRYTPKEVVAPEVFSIDGQESLSRFFGDFEKYFSHKFHGNQRDKCRELGKFLEGEIKKAYNALGGPQIKYKDMKYDLRSWYKSIKIGWTRKMRAKFDAAEMEPGDTFKLYSMRLEELAFQAYPKDKSERSKQLVKHFLSTVPAWFVSCVDKREETMKTVDRHARMTWEDIVTVSEWEDRKQQTRSQQSSDPASGSRRNQVATTQEVPPAEGSQPSSSHSSPQNLNSNARAGGSSHQTRCNFCGVIGHFEKNCRRKVKQSKCFCCQEYGHYARDCQLLVARGGSMPAQNSRQPRCSYCGGPHLGMNCAQRLEGQKDARKTSPTAIPEKKPDSGPGAIAKGWSKQSSSAFLRGGGESNSQKPDDQTAQGGMGNVIGSGKAPQQNVPMHRGGYRGRGRGNGGYSQSQWKSDFSPNYEPIADSKSSQAIGFDPDGSGN